MLPHNDNKDGNYSNIKIKRNVSIHRHFAQNRFFFFILTTGIVSVSVSIEVETDDYDKQGIVRFMLDLN